MVLSHQLPHLYIRWAAWHMSPAKVRRLLENHWLLSGMALPTEGLTDEQAHAAIIRMTGGNFRLLHWLLTQIASLVEINALSQVTRVAVEAARETLGVGVV
jgi:hypothetical protein